MESGCVFNDCLSTRLFLLRVMSDIRGARPRPNRNGFHGCTFLPHAMTHPSPLVAEAVEKVARIRNIEIKLQNSRQYRFNIASGWAYRNYSCTKPVGSDFFNSLSQKPPFDGASVTIEFCPHRRYYRSGRRMPWSAVSLPYSPPMWSATPV